MNIGVKLGRYLSVGGTATSCECFLLRRRRFLIGGGGAGTGGGAEPCSGLRTKSSEFRIRSRDDLGGADEAVSRCLLLLGPAIEGSEETEAVSESLLFHCAAPLSLVGSNAAVAASSAS